MYHTNKTNAVLTQECHSPKSLWGIFRILSCCTDSIKIVILNRRLYLWAAPRSVFIQGLVNYRIQDLPRRLFLPFCIGKKEAKTLPPKLTKCTLKRGVLELASLKHIKRLIRFKGILTTRKGGPNSNVLFRPSSPRRAGMRGIGAAQGFALIELLVVVLIIAILAAIAVPQYQKIIYKTKYNQLKILMVQALREQHLYFLEHGQYTQTLSDLESFQGWVSFTNNTENFRSPDRKLDCGIHTYNGGFHCDILGNSMWLEINYKGLSKDGACFAYQEKNKKICEAIGAVCPEDRTTCSLSFW